MWPDRVVTLLERGQAVAAMSRVVIELPVHLFALQGLMEALQQAELGRRAGANADMAEVVAEMGAEPLGPTSLVD